MAPRKLIKNDGLKEEHFKGFYLQKKDLERYGYTAGCPACDSIRREGKRKPGTQHTEECGVRVETKMREERSPADQKGRRTFSSETQKE